MAVLSSTRVPYMLLFVSFAFLPILATTRFWSLSWKNIYVSACELFINQQSHAAADSSTSVLNRGYW